MPLVTVIIPTFSRAHLIERALNSARNQTLKDIEILVCDDASTDVTRDIVRSFQEKDSRIHLLCLSENQGAGAARNLGMQAAQGKYIAFLDSDDEWLPEKLTRQVERMDAEPPEIGVCFCGAKIIKNSDIVRPVIYVPDKSWEHNTFRKFVMGRIPFVTSTVLFRRTCLAKLGMMVPEMRRNQDIEFLLRLFYHFGLAVIPGLYVEWHLVVSSKSTHFNDIKIALPYHLRHYELIRNKLGRWSAITYRGRMYHSILCEAIRERRWCEIPHYFSQRIRANPFLSFEDMSQLFKAFYRCLFR